MKKKSLEWRNCSESDLSSRIQALIPSLGPGVLCVLEGEMGVGKSAFAREVLRSLCPNLQSRGSPTFPLVHEYSSDAGFPIYHIDLYRLGSEQEFEHSGIGEQLDSPDALVMVEWASLFPAYFERYFAPSSKRKWIRVRIGFGDEASTRTYEITRSLF
jgi:tRNA threonylcarbamoyl adenosine modification protein YjeE